MPEWWTYRLSDFLLFSPRTYYRMLEHYNEAVWPAHLIMTALGLLILGLLRRPGATSGRSISATLAVLWVWISWMFLWNRYATINPVASYLVPLFMLQALLLVWVGVVRARLTFRSRREGAGLLGVTLFIFSLTFYPMLAPLAGRPWRQVEIFGVAPDPTTLATLGLLLLTPGRPRWELLAIPMLWCSISGATLWAMDSPEALIPLLTALLVLLASITFRRRIAG